jgi:acetylornithine deacetylase/succinyl-diaminopimelate desuccinylase-like protein
MDLLALSRDLIAANSVSAEGTSKVVGILKPLYESAGLDVSVQELPSRPGQQNLLGSYHGDDPRGLLLVTHLDTVDAGPPDQWTETGGNPLALTQKGDLLYGLGSADTKLDALCKLFAARGFRDRRLRRTLQLLGTCEEEVGAKGARFFAGSPQFQARFVSCSEPSELTIIRSHKGYAVVDIELSLPDAARLAGPFERVTFEGKSAHSSTPHLGINAVEKALAALRGSAFASLDGGTAANKVPARCTVIRPARDARNATEPVPMDARDASPSAALSQQMFALWREAAQSLEPKSNPDFEPDRCVVNWGIAHIQGVQACLTFDCRLLPGHDPDLLLSIFARKAESLAQTHQARLTLRVSRANPAMALSEPSELLTSARAACRDVGLDDAPKAKPTNTEAGVFAAAGAEAIVFGPGRSTGNAHTANEHNLYSQMKKAIEFYQALIVRLCT